MKTLRLSLLLVFCLFVGSQHAKADNNVAYQDQHVRFTVITEGVVRLEWQPDGHFTDNESFVATNRKYPAANYKVKQSKDKVEIHTSKFRLTYKKSADSLSAANLVIRGTDKNAPFVWRPGMRQEYNLKGTYRTLDGYDGNTYHAWNYAEKKGKVMPLEDGLLSKDGWTVIDDSKGLLFDGDVEDNDPAHPLPWVKERNNNPAQDWYFMSYGHDYKSALKDYTVFAGRIPMPPRFAFGYWWSRYWSYSDGEIRQLVDYFKNYGIPLDVLVVDMDWHWTEKGRGGWTGYTWNTRLFPNPAKFLSYLKDQHLHITLNLHPADGVPSYEDKYPALAEYLGRKPRSNDTIKWQSSDKRFMTGWIEKILRPLEREGVDFWWLDWQQGLYDSKIKTLSNTWWINYCVFTDRLRNNPHRPLLYHRWGGLGNHRYQIGFSGDSYSTWASLEFQPYFNSTASNVLYGYWSHDLGGHMLVNDSAKLDQELFARWMQLGTFLPIMRTHSTKSAAMAKEPWNQGPEFMPVVSKAIRQRYELVPYIYSNARKAYETGVSLCRPLYYDYPESDEAYSYRNEYLFGDDLLIAPITSPMKDGVSNIKVWLPEGAEWYELSTGTLLHGGQTVERSFFIDEYPVYVKAGSIIPTYGKVMKLSSNNEKVTFAIYPSSNNGNAVFYEDNGDDKDYETKYATTNVTTNKVDSSLTVNFGIRKGSYDGMPAVRDYALRLVGVPVPKNVVVDGKPSGFSYSGESLSATIDLPALDPDKEHTIEISYPSVCPRINNGLSGQIRRVRRTMRDMKFRDAGINYVDGLGQMGSVSESIEYAPNLFSTLVETFQNNYSNLPALLDKQQMDEPNKSWFLKNTGYIF